IPIVAPGSSTASTSRPPACWAQGHGAASRRSCCQRRGRPSWRGRGSLSARAGGRLGGAVIVAFRGLGYLMVKGQAGLATATVMSAMLAIGLVGLVIDVLLRGLQQSIQTRRGQ